MLKGPNKTIELLLVPIVHAAELRLNKLLPKKLPFHNSIFLFCFIQLTPRELIGLTKNDSF